MRAVLGNVGPRSWQYGPSASRSVQKRPRANIPQYDPEQVKLVSSLLHRIIFYAQQHFRLFIQVNFRHDRCQGISRLWWRKQQKPSRIKMTIFCFPDEVSCISFYAFVFSRFEFPGSWAIEKKIFKQTVSMAVVRTVKSWPQNSQSENSI